MKKNKLFLCLTLSCLTLSSTISSLLPFINHIEEKNNEVNNQPKIKITRVKYSSYDYGTERILFEINPKINTDEIAYSLKYNDNEEIEDDIFNVLFMPASNYIDITCLKPFDKRVILTIYAVSNESVKASINIDFKEKITLDPTLQVNENLPLTVDTNLVSTGGSIQIDKTIKEEKKSSPYYIYTFF